MINLIFNNVPHLNGEKKSINCVIDRCMVSWESIFELLELRTNISKKIFKICVNTRYYSLNEISTLDLNYFYDDSDFFSFNVKLFKDR